MGPHTRRHTTYLYVHTYSQKNIRMFVAACAGVCFELLSLAQMLQYANKQSSSHRQQRHRIRGGPAGQSHSQRKREEWRALRLRQAESFPFPCILERAHTASRHIAHFAGRYSFRSGNQFPNSCDRAISGLVIQTLPAINGE